MGQSRCIFRVLVRGSVSREVSGQIALRLENAPIFDTPCTLSGVRIKWARTNRISRRCKSHIRVGRRQPDENSVRFAHTSAMGRAMGETRRKSMEVALGRAHFSMRVSVYIVNDDKMNYAADPVRDVDTSDGCRGRPPVRFEGEGYRRQDGYVLRQEPQKKPTSDQSISVKYPDIWKLHI